MVKKLPETNKLNSVDSYVSMALGLAVVLLVGALAYNFSTKKAPPANPATEVTKTATQSAQNTLPAKYTVKDNDTLWSISEQYFKSGYNWPDIQKANHIENPDEIYSGQVLTIPNVQPVIVGDITPAAATTIAPKHQSVVVSPGESLWVIAEREYGTGFKWTDIANANKITDPYIIYTGNTLVLP